MVSPPTIAIEPPKTSPSGAERQPALSPAVGQARLALQPIMIETKLRRPAIGHDVQDRPRLIDRLSRQGCRAALVVAPAGYGKSTLLAQWSTRVDRPVAWVRLDREDSDPAQFWSYVIEALRSAVPEQIPITGRSLTLGSAADPVALVVNAISSLDCGVILILDDYHEVRSNEVDEAVDRLLRYLPAASTVVISTRRDPNLTFPRWRASGRLAEIRQEHLRFTRDEARQWLEAHGLVASPDAVSACVEVFEGWPAAFALALGIIGPAPDPEAALAAVRGDARSVAAYIREEVVDRHRDDRDALMVAALCPQVCGSLLDYVLETTGSHQTLRRLQRSDVLLENIDQRDVWFRLHQLVADYLLAEHDNHPSVHTWTRRAAEWHAANGYPREALSLLLRAKDHGAAAEIINRSWIDQVQSGRLTTLRCDLQRIEPRAAANSPSYLVTRAWLLAYEGRARDALAHVRRAAAVSNGGPLPDGAPSVEAAHAVMNCLFILDGFRESLLSAGRADELVAKDSKWRPLTDLGIGYANYMGGNLEKARVAFDRALVSPSQAVRAHAIGWSAVVDVTVGDPDAARARLDEAAGEWAKDPAYAGLPAVSVARAALECAEGRPIRAVAELEACLQRLGSADPSDRLEVLIWLADAETSIGRSDRAHRRIAEATEIAERIGGSDRHAERMADIARRLGSATTREGRGPGLTDRESRILQLLSATHLSQREIGRELGVSFNTIKSHVKAIYVKLGACSREEASQIARVRGLV